MNMHVDRDMMTYDISDLLQAFDFGFGGSIILVTMFVRKQKETRSKYRNYIAPK